MASIFGQANRFGAHGDLMSASPEDEAGKMKLLEEIKSRARRVGFIRKVHIVNKRNVLEGATKTRRRAEFSRKNLPQAEMLYAKGLEIRPEDATLHGNLAAVRLGLNKARPALESSEEAVRLDPAYAKGHYRKGQALMTLSRPAEAVASFKAGAQLEPDSKLWPPLIEKAQKAVKEGSSVAREEGSRGNSSNESGSTPAGARPPARRSTPSAESAEGTREQTSGRGASSMKGYKKTADGRVTTYFNNELSEEAKALIGDIAPKKLETTGNGGDGEAAGNDVSVWNKAGTWESRDMTSWSKQRLEELLKDVDFDAPESVVQVVKIDNLDGDAEISFSRGRKRYLFDFHFDLKWEVPDLECGPAKGVLAYPDVGQDGDGAYDAECRVDSNTPIAAKHFVDRHVRAEGSGLRKAVEARLAAFAEEFNAK